ncbi:hypothetical protein KIW84_033818 [Lathyrus oleraceus]|uniref:Reverse transcriptase domain-containing protein n=1 Tax=Pisum sativum TaxID=3888 RepID=A0A9D4Y134_PEA|nr:hypothetical protein KIW84_033818 [Pisum sativum]
MASSSLLVSHLSSFTYVEAEEEVRTLFQALSVVEEIQKTGASMSSLKDARKNFQAGSNDKLGRVVEVVEDKSRAGMGFQQGPFNGNVKAMQPVFRSGGFINEDEQHSTTIIEDEDEEACANFVTHDQTYNNWVVVDVPVIVYHSKLILKPIEHNDPTPSPNFDFHGSEDDVKEVKIGSQLCPEVKKGLVDLLQEYSYVFTWSCQDMPGLDADIVEHRFPLKPEYPPVKQKLRRTHPDISVKIKEEVHKQIDVGFLVTSEYPQWVANILHVSKKDGKVHLCVDYRDLNKGSLKDNFPLPHIDMLVGNAAKFKVFPFMDEFSIYNQIKMAPEDMENTIFITPWGTFYYRVMPFGLNNVGATY